MSKILKLASAQVRTLDTTHETLRALEATTQHAAAQGVDLILFPEAYLGGYPRNCAFGAAVGARSDEGREQFLHYFRDAVDMGDTPTGAGQAWIDKSLELPRGKKYRGDGIREELERIARETGVFVVTGFVEKSGGTLYCAIVYVDPKYGVLGKRRKLMPTGSERLIWGQGTASTLRAVTAEIRGVRLTIGSAICWENYMPLLRYSLYSQNINLWFAPTADARDTWGGLMQTIACEGRCFVVSANQCTKKKHLPKWISGVTKEESQTNGTAIQEIEPRSPIRRSERRKSTICKTDEGNEICLPIREELKEINGDSSAIDSSATSHVSDAPTVEASNSTQATSTADREEFACRGGSSIVSPMGKILSGPLWEVEDELLISEVDFEDCERGRLDIDVAGSYSRSDQFKLTVEGLDISPPPF